MPVVDQQPQTSRPICCVNVSELIHFGIRSVCFYERMCQWSVVYRNTIYTYSIVSVVQLPKWFQFRETTFSVRSFNKVVNIAARTAGHVGRRQGHGRPYPTTYNCRNLVPSIDTVEVSACSVSPIVRHCMLRRLLKLFRLRAKRQQRLSAVITGRCKTVVKQTKQSLKTSGFNKVDSTERNFVVDSLLDWEPVRVYI